MNVLSLFDGMSSGQIALNRAGIKYDNYFASEVDKHAIKVTQANYPNTIQLGDVTKWREWNLPQIDLILAGSPCQGFSKASRDRKNLDDPRSKLFWQFLDILSHYSPKYYLLENVIMDAFSEETITETLDCDPIEIDAALVSAQSRRRLYWTNIPINGLPINRGLTCGDVFDLNIERFIYPKDKIKAQWNTVNYLQYDVSGKGYKSQGFRAYRLNRKHGTLPSSRPQNKGQILMPNGDIAFLNANDWEILQTVPSGYTNHVSETQRMVMLGNGWTVDVIVWILSFMKDGEPRNGIAQSKLF